MVLRSVLTTQETGRPTDHNFYDFFATLYMKLKGPRMHSEKRIPIQSFYSRNQSFGQKEKTILSMWIIPTRQWKKYGNFSSAWNQLWMNRSIFPLNSNILPRKDFAHKKKGLSMPEFFWRKPPPYLAAWYLWSPLSSDRGAAWNTGQELQTLRFHKMKSFVFVLPQCPSFVFEPTMTQMQK